MTKTLLRSMLSAVGLTTMLCTPCHALRVRSDRAKVAAEAQAVERMAAAGDVGGLTRMLSEGEFPSKEVAAWWLGEIGDERALPDLQRLNRVHGGWVPSFEEDLSAGFAVAICKIHTRGQPETVRVATLLDLLDGRGPAVPEVLPPTKAVFNGVKREFPPRLDRNRWVARELAVELDKYDDPSITPRLRASENRWIAPYGIWREVRGLSAEEAIARCVQIARQENRAQQYGAIHCLGRLWPDSIHMLDQLAWDGYHEAVDVLGDYSAEPNVFALLCTYIDKNKSASVRSNAVRVISYVRTEPLRVRSLQALVGALYDPSERVRRGAARAISNRAYKRNKPHFDQIEESSLIALKHPDLEVREPILEGLIRLGCERLDALAADPPPIRTDLEEPAVSH